MGSVLSGKALRRGGPLAVAAAMVVVIAAAVIGPGGRAAAADDPPRSPPEKPRAEPRPRKPGAGTGKAQVERNRQAWRSLSEKEREQIRRIHGILQGLEPQERERLLERLKQMKPEERRQEIQRAREAAGKSLFDKRARELQRGFLNERLWKLPAELESQIEGLEGEERDRAIARFFAEKRRKLLEQVPASLRERIRGLSPRRQHLALESYLAQQTFEKVFKEPGEREQILGVGSENLRALLGEKLEDRPAFFPASAWKRWLAIEPYERVRVVMRIYQLRRGDDAPWNRADGKDRARDEEKGKAKEEPDSGAKERRAQK